MIRPAAIIFDFDGVILDSIEIKSRAFADLFAEWPQHQSAIVRYHHDNAGLSRYAKFRWIYGTLLHRELTEEQEQALDRRFSDLVAVQMRRCPFLSGAREFIEQQSTRRPLFVASGTPDAELRAIVEDRGLTPYFRGVFGSPRDKAALITQIASENAMPFSDLLFIGDGRQDYEAARALAVPFIGIAPAGEAAAFPGAAAVAADLDEVSRRWAAISAALNTGGG